MVARRTQDGDAIYTSLYAQCPGCDTLHCVTVRLPETAPNTPGPFWDWNGNLAAPTISPSILSRGVVRCHSYLRDGQWQFLDDCEHPLAGKTVPMIPLPEWMLR